MSAKIFQTGKSDCTWAGIATILGLPYEGFPACPFKTKNVKYSNYIGVHGIIDGDAVISEDDNFLREMGIKLIYRDINNISSYSRKLRLAVVMSHVFEAGYYIGHTVVLKGKKIWHDPMPNGVSFTKPENLVFAMEIINERKIHSGL
jgi:hypothetical protein